MGEIATWSAVKSKVGLGKDGNDCPTKAELLALSPTGTGENYVGLELSNAGSYGNNETVKLEDIHKVTWKYTFTLWTDTLNFSALGGEPTNEKPWFVATSTRTKYLDGVATSTVESVAYSHSGRPSWVTWADGTGWRATENLELTARSKTDGTIIQQDSGKTYTVKWYQAAASQSWSYGWSVTPTSMSFGATGGTKTFSVTSYKQELRNGHNYGNQIALTYTRANSGSVSGTGTSVIMTNNTSTSTKSGTVTLTQAETGKKLTISCSQSAGYLTYSEITASGGAVTDIPASGGTRSSFTTLPTYSQTYGWNGATSGAGTITSGATITYSAAVTAASLGTTAKARTLKGTLTATISLNGKTKTVPIDVYQAENKITSTTNGTPVISLSANSYTISNTGGSVNISASVSIPTTNHWSSGSTSAGTPKSATPTVSASGTGFSLNSAKTVLTASENTGTSSRSCTVTATYTGATTKTITVTQSAATVSYTYEFKYPAGGEGSTHTLSSWSNLGGDLTYTLMSRKVKTLNGSISGFYDVTPVLQSKPNWVDSIDFVQLPSNNQWHMVIHLSENTGAVRSGTIVVKQSEGSKTLTFNVSQSAKTESSKYYLGFDSPTGSKTLSKTVVATANTIRAISAYAFSTKVINGTENTGTRYPSGLTVSSKPTWATVTITHQGNGLYSISIDITENTSTTSRSGSVVIKPNDNDDYGWQLTINLSQNAATITYEYIFEIA